MAGHLESGLSRRGLLKQAAIGTAVVGALAFTPALHASQRRQGVQTSAPPGAASGSPIIAYVRDAERGEVSIMVGTQEITRTDPELVTYLVRCCGSQDL
jgi:hypothetical protein